MEQEAPNAEDKYQQRLRLQSLRDLLKHWEDASFLASSELAKTHRDLQHPDRMTRTARAIAVHNRWMVF